MKAFGVQPYYPARMESRFIRIGDPFRSKLLWEMPDTWWSRPYEYEWARQFAEPGDVCLDAACGLGHPLKFHLADVCREVHACDLDPRILSREAILHDVEESYGPAAVTSFPERYLTDVEFARASLAELPYSDRKFDKIYCISVLEHLPTDVLDATFGEFARVLKDDGLIIVTLDYPSVDLAFLRESLGKHGLRFAGPASFLRPDDAIFSAQYGLFCYRAVLCKDRTPKVLVGSPIKQDSHVLQEFLNGLLTLDTSLMQVDYCFVDDNDDRQSQALLQEFARKCTTHLIRGYGNLRSQDYRRDEMTHHWRDDLIQKVASYKDRIIDYALAEGYDFLLFVDSDIVMHPLTLNQLVLARRDIVSEIFWTRWTPDAPELPQVWCTDQYTLFRSHRGEATSQEVAQQRQAEFLAQLRKPGLYEVGGLGACTLISREALQAGVRFADIPNISFLGEDRYFCIRAAALGFSLHVDTNLPAYHIYRKQELPGVAKYRQEFPVMGERLYLVSSVQAGLERWGSTDFRSITGMEGIDWFGPNLQAQRLSDAQAEVDKARTNGTIATTVVETSEILALDLVSGRASLRVWVVNEGIDQSRLFRERYVALVEAVRVEGRWCIDSVDFQPLDQTATREGTATAPTPAVTTAAAQGNESRSAWTRKKQGNKLVLSMLVRNEADRYLRKVLEHASSYVDEVVILDDASDDNTAEICRMAVKDKPLTLVTNPAPMFGNEIVLRKQQWELTLGTNPDWILFLDADEMFEDRIRREIRHIINQDQFDVASFRLYDFWDQHRYRDDQWWQAHHYYRPFLIRYVPDFSYQWRETSQHCGRMPMNVLNLPNANSDLRVKHLGWATEKDRQAKYERYMRLDPEGKFGILEQYKSILDPNPRLIRWVE